MIQINSKKLAGSIAIPALLSLIGSVGSAGALPELDCLVEPNVVVDVGSPEHGVVETIAVDRSDTVAAHDVLAKLESSEQSANVRKARARVNMAAEINARKATLELAERKQQRMRDLFASDAISTHQRDEVETELKMAQMQLQQARDASSLARIELDRVRAELDKRTIRSPISGVVVERFVAPGEYVNEKPLLRVAQMHPLRVETVVPAELFGQIKTGMQARVFTEAQGGQSFNAEVTIVDRLIDPASGTFGVRLELPNPDYAIPSGLNCRLRILPQLRAATVTEPETAVDSNVTAAAVAVTPELPVESTEPEPMKSEPVAATPETERVAAAPEPPARTEKPEPVVTVAQTETAAAQPEPVAATPEPASPAMTGEPQPTITVAKSGPAVKAAKPEPVAAMPEQAVVPSKPQAVAPAVAVATPVKPPSLTCTSFGPFDSDDQLDGLLATLGAGAREVGRRAEDDETTEGFFVATHALATVAAAERLSQSMKKFGMNDLDVLPDGPTGARVSLGLFEDRDYAKTLQQKLAALGIETEVLPNRLTSRQVWLDVEMPVDSFTQTPWQSRVSEVGTADCPPSVWNARRASLASGAAGACLSIGPFRREQQIDALVAVLGSDSREIDRRREREETETGFIVMTTPRVSVDEAGVLAASIRDRGVKDLAVMRAGSYKGQVSLGLYTQKPVAMKRLQEMRNLGLDVEIVPKRNVSVQYWSDVELSASAIKQAPWKKIAPDVMTTACAPSSYVMADAAEAP